MNESRRENGEVACGWSSMIFDKGDQKEYIFLWIVRALD